MADRRFIKKPELYDYHDYRLYLKDWLGYKKLAEPQFSLRKLCSRVGIALGYLSMVIKGERSLTKKTIIKLLPELKFSSSEAKYFICLSTLADSNKQNERLKAVKDMQRYTRYKKKNTDEAVVYQYLSHWFNVALRELMQTQGACLDSEWLRSRFIEKVSIKDVNRAVKFLLENEFLLKNKDGQIVPQEERLRCEEQIHKLGLTEFHKSMFKLAINAIDLVPSQERWITGYTFPLSRTQFEQVKKILVDAKEAVANLNSPKEKRDMVYHAVFAAFPLTKSQESKND